MQFEYRVKGACWGVVVLLSQCLAFADRAITAEPLPAIEAGTIVVDEQSTRWNRSVLLATPRISSGEINKLSEPIRESVSKLKLVHSGFCISRVEGWRRKVCIG